MKVCYFGTYREQYSRNQIMIASLQCNGVEVIECHVPLWRGEADRVSAAQGGWLSPIFLWRVFITYVKLLWKYVNVGEHDILILGYPGQIDIFLAWVLAKLSRKPVVWDVFMSLYLIAAERGLVSQHPLTGKMLYYIEKLAYRLPDMLVQDTDAYVKWFGDKFNVSASRFCLVPTGADDRVFYPREEQRCEDGPFRVLYYGTFIPNHGVRYMVEAARLLQDMPDIHFEFVGDGPTKARAIELAKTYNLGNITFTGWVEKQDLPLKLAQADVCLGAFGTTPQSMMTIQNKIYEGLAMGKPVISGESPVVRAALKDGEHIILCRRESPQSLAEAIERLYRNPDLIQRLSKSGHEVYVRNYTVSKLGAQFKTCLCEKYSL